MRSGFSATLLAVAWLCAVPAVVAGEGAGPAVDADVLRTLRPGHPRLIVLDEDIARVRELIATNDDARGLRDALHARAVKMLDEPPIVHELVGPRLLRQSRACLDRVSTLAGLYRLEGDRRFAERAEKEMLTAAAFKDWNPSHFLDTAEMSNALGIGYDWLYDVLSPASRRIIREAIVRNGLTPGLDGYNSNVWWSSSEHNWNQVCNGGLTVGALAIADKEPVLASQVLDHARQSIPRAMRTLAPDGGWPEGPGYWHYAMRYTAYYQAALNTALGHDFGLQAFDGFAETGLFWMHCIGPTNLKFNFADGGAGGTDAPEMLYFSRVFDKPVYAAFQREHRADSDILNLLWYDVRGQRTDYENLSTAAAFRGIDVAFLRSAWHTSDALFVGFKGGDNQANHSHLDLGTFVLDALGERWAVELGADDYNLPAYFGNKRWTYYRLRTEGQNTLVLNDENQDPKAKAPFVAFARTDNRSHVVADLSAAYAKHAGRVQRGIALIDGACVLLQDEIESDRPVEIAWTMHTHAKIDIDGRAATLSLKGKRLHARIIEPADARWSLEQPRLEPPQRPLKNTRKLMIHRTGQGRTRIAVVMAPGRSLPDDAVPIEPLGDWKSPGRPAR